MSNRSARVVALALALLLSLVLVTPGAARAAGGWDGAQIAAWAAGPERAWAAMTEANGAIPDRLEPPYGAFNYGTLMLAQAQLRAARRSADDELQKAAVAQVLGTLRRDPQGDPFYVLGATTLLRDGQAGRLPASAWARIEQPLSDWIGRIAPFRRRVFGSTGGYDNWRLVFAAGAAELAQAGLLGSRDGIAADPVALRAEVRRIVTRLMPRNAGPRVPVRRVGLARALSDPPWQPPAYHLFSALLLERVYQSEPDAFSATALRIRREAGRYALALMAPDGALTPAGRSAEQSWVLAAAVDLGAMRASDRGRDAPAWRAFAERAMDRLVRVHGQLDDGTIPVVPGLWQRWDASIMDGYASMTQYNGLTLSLLQDAADRWPDGVRVGRVPADRAGHLVADVGGARLVWGRAPRVWWALSMRRTQRDGRYQQGLTALKVLDGGAWRDLLASRPQSGLSSGWELRTPRGTARLVLAHVRGSGSRVRLFGAWRLADGRRWRAAHWELRTHRATTTITTERLRAGETLTAGLWLAAGVAPSFESGWVLPSACVVTASGWGCPVRLRLEQPVAARLTLRG
ncbi:hypothetical protein Q5424_26265 [Conexibacter sp. JD483]|uniref:hypothetical protein n=1 Tax=unclassified Conexibacter TaxID=2627773 RepID=UPI002727698C|nr:MULTISPECIES: hypothetical protein [unclassified Conexibacter]MDO8189475.1 hypothetical protein [Conexibacter sp. CPCC 205706]MDO8202065.1 hypothetical protein [Conexibacter sp. CPCC 205762]MDR9372632.1 hypothetical protein [Conexibacter sp. JD483]